MPLLLGQAQGGLFRDARLTLRGIQPAREAGYLALLVQARIFPMTHQECHHPLVALRLPAAAYFSANTWQFLCPGGFLAMT